MFSRDPKGSALMFSRDPKGSALMFSRDPKGSALILRSRKRLKPGIRGTKIGSRVWVREA